MDPCGQPPPQKTSIVSSSSEKQMPHSEGQHKIGKALEIQKSDFRAPVDFQTNPLGTLPSQELATHSPRLQRSSRGRERRVKPSPDSSNLCSILIKISLALLHCPLPLPTAQTSLFMLPIYILFWALQPVSLPENLKLAHYGHMGQKHPPLLLTQSWTWDYSSSSSTISSCSSPFSIMFLLPSLLLLLLLSHPVTCGHTRSFLGSVRIPLHGKLDPSIARIWAVPQVPRATAWGVALPDLPDASLLPKVPLSEEQEPLH